MDIAVARFVATLVVGVALANFVVVVQNKDIAVWARYMGFVVLVRNRDFVAVLAVMDLAAYLPLFV